MVHDYHRVSVVTAAWLDQADEKLYYADLDSEYETRHLNVLKY